MTNIELCTAGNTVEEISMSIDAIKTTPCLPHMSEVQIEERKSVPIVYTPANH